MKVKKEIMVTVCDGCGKDTSQHSKCMICEKDLCSDCNPITDLTFEARWFILCEEHFEGLSLKEFIKIAKRR